MLESKVIECIEVATMDQTRRRGESKAMQMADSKVAAMKDEMNKKIRAAKCEVQYASGDARTTVLAESLYRELVTANREGDHKRDHKKEIERQSLVHKYKIKAKDDEIEKTNQQTEKYCNVASAANAKVRELALKNRLEVYELKIQHTSRVKELQLKHVDVIKKKMRYITQLQNHGNDLMEMMYDMEEKVGEQQKVTRNTSKYDMVLSKLAQLRLVEMNDYRDNFRNMKDELVTAQRAGIEQAEAIGEYESLIDEMTEEYGATIHDITPLFLEKRWVKKQRQVIFCYCVSLYMQL